MRFCLAFVMSTALMFGCGDSNADTGGTGGTGGIGGIGAAGGVGGAGRIDFDALRLSVVMDPSSCTVGIEAEYIVHVFVEGASGPVEISGTATNCEGAIEGVTSRVKCPYDEEGVTLNLEISDDTGPILSSQMIGAPFCDALLFIAPDRGE